MRRSGCCRVIGCSASWRGTGRASRPRADRCCTSPSGTCRSVPIRCSSRRTRSGRSTSATSRWSSGRSATRRTPRRSTIRPKRSDAPTGSRPRSRSTSSGTRPADADTDRRRIRAARGRPRRDRRRRAGSPRARRGRGATVAPVDDRPGGLRAGRAADGRRPHERAGAVRVPRRQHDRPRAHPGWLARARSSSSLTSIGRLLTGWRAVVAATGARAGAARPARRSTRSPGRAPRAARNGARIASTNPTANSDAEEGVPSRPERVADAVVVVVDRVGRRRRRVDVDRQCRQRDPFRDVRLRREQSLQIGLAARQLALEIDHLTEIGRGLEELADAIDALLGVADAHRQIDELIRHVLRLLVRRQHGSELVEAGEHGAELGRWNLDRQRRPTGHGRVARRARRPRGGRRSRCPTRTRRRRATPRPA